MQYALLLIVLSATIPLTGIAQQEQKERLTPTEFTIPPSPVFDLMGVTPSQVNRTADIKDFKVDWSFKSWKLNPNLAIQSQPVWELFYHRKNISKYQQANALSRKLASLDISLGTVQNEENDRRIGFATKMNIINKKDPLMAGTLYNDIESQFEEEAMQATQQIKALQQQLDTTSNILEKPLIRASIADAQTQLSSIHTRRNAAINERAQLFTTENWNAAKLDIAFGRIYTYQSDSAGTLKKLRLNRNTGWGIWLNGGVPLGKRWLLSGLIRTTWYEEELNFTLKDTDTQEEFLQTSIAANTLYSVGANIRYGGPLYSFFAEMLYEKKSLSSPIAALNKSFTLPEGTQLQDGSVQWSVVNPNAITIGGDWRISQNVIINYGMRWIFNKNWNTQAFVPVAGISCMMR